MSNQKSHPKKTKGFGQKIKTSTNNSGRQKASLQHCISDNAGFTFKN